MGKKPKYELLEEEQIKQEVVKSKNYETIRLNNLSLEKKFNQLGNYDTKLLFNHNSKDELQVCETFLKSKTTQEVKEIFREIINHWFSVAGTKFFINEHIKSLIVAAKYHDFFIRNFKDWEPNSKNIHKQLSHFLSFIFCNYPSPEFLVNCFFSNFNFEVHPGAELYIHIGQGNSFKSFEKNLPLSVNKKKTYSHLFTTPSHLGLFEGLRRAQVLSLGGTESLFNALMKSGFTNQSNYRNEFWSTAVEFYIKAPMFDYDLIPQLNDYINNRIQNQNPKAPFTLTGRNIEQIIRKSEEWHSEFTTRRGKVKVMVPDWVGYPVGNYNKIINKKLPNGGNVDIKYDITQLKKHKDLIDEGRAMNHCVSSYAESCARGMCSIFSVKRDGVRAATIEVRKRMTNGHSYTIGQIKKKGNLKPDSDVLNIIEEWADKENINYSNWF